MKSRFFTVSTSPRTRRATVPQTVMAMIVESETASCRMMMGPIGSGSMLVIMISR